jgi:hypothetical protein
MTSEREITATELRPPKYQNNNLWFANPILNIRKTIMMFHYYHTSLYVFFLILYETKIKPKKLASSLKNTNLQVIYFFIYLRSYLSFDDSGLVRSTIHAADVYGHVASGNICILNVIISKSNSFVSIFLVGCKVTLSLIKLYADLLVKYKNQ